MSAVREVELIRGGAAADGPWAPSTAPSLLDRGPESPPQIDGVANDDADEPPPAVNGKAGGIASMLAPKRNGARQAPAIPLARNGKVRRIADAGSGLSRAATATQRAGHAPRPRRE